MGAHARLDARPAPSAAVEAVAADNVRAESVQTVRLLALVAEGNFVIVADADQQGDFGFTQHRPPRKDGADRPLSQFDGSPCAQAMLPPRRNELLRGFEHWPQKSSHLSAYSWPERPEGERGRGSDGRCRV